MQARLVGFPRTLVVIVVLAGLELHDPVLVAALQRVHPASDPAPLFQAEDASAENEERENQVGVAARKKKMTDRTMIEALSLQENTNV